MAYRVMIDDNFLCPDESRRYAQGEYTTYAEAFAVCKEIVDRFLRHEYVPGMPASALYLRYMMFGRNPFLVDGADESELVPGFSAWDFARVRCQELCAGAIQTPAA